MSRRQAIGARGLAFWQRNDRLYRLIVGSFKTGFRVLAIDFDIRGTELIPKHGGAVIANNHISFLDYAFTGFVADRHRRLVRFLAKSSVFRSRLGGPLMRGMRHVAVDRSARSTAFAEASRLLADGELVGVFPEGTISRAWTLKPFQTGAAALAVTQRVPLIPLILWGGQRIWTVDGHHSLKRHVRVDIWIGDPIEPDDSWGERDETVIAEVNQRLFDSMSALLDRAQREYPDRPSSAADGWWLPRHLGGSAPDPGDAAVIDKRKRIH